jgi:hypothetical protein
MTMNLDQLPSVSMGSDEAFNDLAKGGEFLKYVKLYTKGKPIDTGKIRPGHWGIPQNDERIDDLGESIDVIPLARRPKALDMTDKSAIIVSYDEQSPEFARIRAKSNEKESKCQHGISFLVLERSTGQFLEVYFGAKSHRPEAKNVYAYMRLTQEDIDRKAAAGEKVEGLVPHGPLPVTLKIRLAEKKDFSWHVPSVVKCSTPFARLPSNKAVVDEIKKFLTPKSGGSEKAPEDTRKQRAH